MPVIIPSTYKKPPLLVNSHVETIFPAILRKVPSTAYQRERITTEDEDFLDIDWSREGNKSLVILSHGLEGDTYRPYMQGMVRAMNDHQFDALAWNFRGCSGEVNRRRRFYHSGATEDLKIVIEHAITQQHYERIFLIGFSLGGNMTLKYLGEAPNTIPSVIKGAVTFSVPMDLHSSCLKISKPANIIYSRRFLKSLIQKIVQKAAVRNDLSTSATKDIKSLKDFDDAYTAPLHGFENAIDYYNQCSSLYFVNDIQLPTLIVNAKNDPFLSNACFPFDIAKEHPLVHLETPEHGGHVGFQSNINGYYWSEIRAVEFLKNIG